MLEGKGISLVIGADGFFGQALFDHLRQSGKTVVGTTRRQHTVDSKTRIRLDFLGQDMSRWSCSRPVDAAYICAGVAKVEECDRDPEYSRRVNEATIKLARNFLDQGIFIVYVSSNQVFNGLISHTPTDAPYSPVTEYGRQKVEIEKDFQPWLSSVAILRCSKALGTQDVLFNTWIASLKAGKPIHPFKDMYMAPAPIGFVAKTLALLGEKKCGGIFQLSGPKDISYADAAYRAAEIFGVNPSLVQPITIRESGKEALMGRSYRYSTLNMDKLTAVLGISPPNVWQAIDDVFINLMSNV